MSPTSTSTAGMQREIGLISLTSPDLAVLAVPNGQGGAVAHGRAVLGGAGGGTGASGLLYRGVNFTSAVGAVVATINLLGPGLGKAAANVAGVDDAVKWLSLFAMLVGRLKVFTVLILFRRPIGAADAEPATKPAASPAAKSNGSRDDRCSSRVEDRRRSARAAPWRRRSCSLRIARGQRRGPVRYHVRAA